MLDTKAFEHGCGESFRKMSANAWRADEICEIAKSGCNGSNGRDISEKSVEKWFIRLCI